MDTIATDFSSNHVDDIAWTWGFVVALPTVGESARHDADGTTVNQWLTEIAFIEDHGSIDCGDA